MSVHTCRSCVHVTPRHVTYWNIHRPSLTGRFVGYNDIGLLGEQSSQKWKISCLGRRWTAVQNLTPLASSSAQKSITVQTHAQKTNSNRYSLSTPCLSTCVDNKAIAGIPKKSLCVPILVEVQTGDVDHTARNCLRRIFPVSVLGIVGMNTTPPRRCLKFDTWSTQPQRRTHNMSNNITHNYEVINRTNLSGEQYQINTRCRPSGTLPYWPAVQCRPPDRPRARPPARGPSSVRRPARRQRYRRRRQTPASKTILAH